MLRIHDILPVAVSLLFLSGLKATDGAANPARPWGDLVGNSPFASGLRAGPSPGLVAGLEFRGVVRDGGEVWVNLYDPASKRAQWCPVPGASADGATMESYDQDADHLVIVVGGRRLELALRQGRVSLPANIAPLAVPEVLDPARPGENERESFVRQLPPEAREMLEQVTRRRSLRVPNPAPAAIAGPAFENSRQ